MMSTNASSITLTWNVANDQIEVEFVIVDDSNQATVLRSVLNLCACHNQGTCLSVEEDNVDDNVGNNTGRFNILPCVCQNGYTGAFCETDLGACEENSQPCYPGVQCSDLRPPANESGFECGLCSVGLTGNGIECTDIDECSPVGDCMQICENTIGGDNCKCHADFKVENADPKSCIPKDPCLLSDGKEKCSCRTGYALEEDGITCTDIDANATNDVTTP